MNKTLLLSEIMQLSRDERMDLIEDIWESLGDTGYAASPSPAQLAEAKRRLEEHRLDPGTAIPAEKVLKELQSRLK